MTDDRPALVRYFPRLASLPRVPLGLFPTRIDAIDVTDPNGRARRIHVKREDLCSDVYGGNKVRKLEFIMAEAKSRGATRLITVGAAGSHHALATTVHGRAHGFDVTLVLFPQPLTPHVRDVLLMDHALGAEIRWAQRMQMVPLALMRARLKHRGRGGFNVAAGGSDALGTLGWVSAGLEIADQIERGECERPSRVHVAAGTLGTAAGLAMGLALAGLDIPVAATRITSRIITNEHALNTLLRGTAAILQNAGVDAPIERAAGLVEIRHGQIGRGYGRITEEALAAEEAFARAGLRLDDTYTAKAAADVLATPGDESVLFVHTLSAAEPLDSVRTATFSELPPAVAAYLAQEGGSASH